jgi:hypothetical protein
LGTGPVQGCRATTPTSTGRVERKVEAEAPRNFKNSLT